MNLKDRTIRTIEGECIWSKCLQRDIYSKIKVMGMDDYVILSNLLVACTLSSLCKGFSLYLTRRNHVTHRVKSSFEKN